jgi:hypothetical protein
MHAGRFFLTGIGVLVLLGSSRAPAAAQGLTVAPHAGAVPPGLAAPVAAALAPGGPMVTIGPTTAEFWWVKGIAAGSGLGAATGRWREVPEGALVGAVRLGGPLRDIRGRTVKAGLYTLRYALQPANGDHIGVSPFREFLLVSPASADTDARPTGYEGVVDMSRQSIGSSHPGVLSVDPPETTAPPGSVTTNEAGHQGIAVEVPGPDGRAIRFGLILVGKIEA